MEHAEISLHQVKVYECVAQSKRWMTNKEIAEVTGVAPRTAREHTKRLVALDIFDQAELFPNHGYRLSEKADKRNASYVLRLKHAQTVFTSMQGKS